MKKKLHRPGHPEDLLDNTAFLIIDTGRLMRKHFDRKMQALDLTRPEWYLIAHMYFFNGLTQQELADAVDITKGGMAKLIARMEEKGLIERKDEVRDGRASKRVFLTKHGWTLANKVDAESVSMVSTAVSKLTVAQTTQLHALLRGVRAEFSSGTQPFDEAEID